MSVAKRAVYACAERFGVNSVLRRISQSRLLVLCYHGVVHDRPPENRYLYRNAVSQTCFEEQLATLARHFSPICADQLVAALDNGGTLPRASVLVTFDDGFKNNLDCAAPILRKFGIPAVFHVATGYIGTQRVLWPLEVDLLILRWPVSRAVPMPSGLPDAPMPERAGRTAIAQQVRNACKSLPDDVRREYLDRLRCGCPDATAREHRELLEFMGWDDVRELHRAGFDIGSHSIEHPILSRLDPDTLRRELVESKSRIESELQASCRFLAYPNGGASDYNDGVKQATTAAGYRVAFSLAECRARPQSLSAVDVPRICIDTECSAPVFRARVSGFYEILNRFRG
jgi:peptidoglycan/xylan/chitin deacetylase (PgdA/CDA1 family)